MKFICFVFLLFCFVSQAQEKKLSLSTNLCNLAVKGPSIALNYDQSSRFSYQLYGSFGNFDKYMPSGTYTFKTLILDVKYNIEEFLYAGPYLRYIDKRVTRESYVDNTGFFSIPGRDFKGTGISAGLMFGARIANSELLNFEVFAGGGLGKFVSQQDFSGNDPRNAFLDARIGVLIGLKVL